MPRPPERYALALRRPLRWRDAADDVVELHDPVRDEWARLAPWTRGVLAGLEAGEPIEALARHARGDETRVRRFVQTLARVGYIEVRVPLPERLGAFEVERELGRGGVGIAYLCRGEDGARVVVKRAWGFLNPLEAAEAALRRESENLRRLASPHVARWIAGFEEDATFHLAREYVPGASVTERYDGAPERDAAEAARVCAEAGAALLALHARGMVLIDHKPGNFLIDEDARRVVLMDVGHAMLAPEGSLTLRASVGTRGFLAPEMQERRVATPRSDVWGLGRLLAFVRTGRLVRRGEPTLDEVVEGLAPREAALVRRLCAVDPAERPATVAEALRDLRAALG